MNRYRYVRDEGHNPLAVIACIGPGMVGVAVCSKHDRFNKKRGREIAEGRALVGSDVVITDRKFVNRRGETKSLCEVINLLVKEELTRSFVNSPEPTPVEFNPTKDI